MQKKILVQANGYIFFLLSIITYHLSYVVLSVFLSTSYVYLSELLLPNLIHIQSFLNFGPNHHDPSHILLVSTISNCAILLLSSQTKINPYSLSFLSRPLRPLSGLQIDGSWVRYLSMTQSVVVRNKCPRMRENCLYKLGFTAVLVGGVVVGGVCQLRWLNNSVIP